MMTTYHMDGRICHNIYTFFIANIIHSRSLLRIYGLHHNNVISKRKKPPAFFLKQILELNPRSNKITHIHVYSGGSIEYPLYDDDHNNQGMDVCFLLFPVNAADINCWQRESLGILSIFQKSKKMKSIKNT